MYDETWAYTTLPPIIMEVEHGGLENDFSLQGTSMIMGGRVGGGFHVFFVFFLYVYRAKLGFHDPI